MYILCQTSIMILSAAALAQLGKAIASNVEDGVFKSWS